MARRRITIPRIPNLDNDLRGLPRVLERALDHRNEEVVRDDVGDRAERGAAAGCQMRKVG